MLLQTLANFPTVGWAAKEMAGNWKNWKCFAWFGSDEIPDNGNVMLGYLVNHEATIRQLTNLEYVRAELKPYWGDLTEGALVGDFGADFCGDKNMLTGLMMRVFVNGKITKPFRKLYQIAKQLDQDGECIVDQDTFDRVLRREMLGHVHSYLEYECRKRGWPFTPELVEQVADNLIANEVDFDNDDVERQIAVEMGWEEEEVEVD